MEFGLLDGGEDADHSGGTVLWKYLRCLRCRMRFSLERIHLTLFTGVAQPILFDGTLYTQHIETTFVAVSEMLMDHEDILATLIVFD